MADRVYIETTIVSYLTARPSRDVVIAGHQQTTQEWWSTQRTSYELCVSQLVLGEAGAGDPQAAQKRLEILKDMTCWKQRTRPWIGEGVDSSGRVAGQGGRRCRPYCCRSPEWSTLPVDMELRHLLMHDAAHDRALRDGPKPSIMGRIVALARWRQFHVNR